MINIKHFVLNTSYDVDVEKENIKTTAELKNYLVNYLVKLDIIPGVRRQNIKLLYNKEQMNDESLVPRNGNIILAIVPIKCDIHK